jgi:biotin transporter BioY
MLIYNATGTNPMSPQPFIGGFVLNFIIATLAAYLLSLSVAKMTAYSQRVIFVTLLGVFAALTSHIVGWNWMYIPTGYSLVMSADTVINSLVGGLVIAWQIKPETA